MAGKISAKNAVINIDDSGGTPRNVSAAIHTYEIVEDANAKSIAGFGEGSDNFTPTLPVKSIKFECYNDTTATTGLTTVLRGILGSSTGKTVSVTPEVGGQTFSGEFMLKDLGTKGAVDGVIELSTIEFLVMGATAPAWA